jgi:hypothetical protein
MRLPIVLACFAAVIDLAAPAQADADGDFLAGLNNAGITCKTDLTPSPLAGGR